MDAIIAIIVAVPIFLATALLWGIALYLWGERRLFLLRATRVQGTVVGLRESATPRNEHLTLYHPIVQFQDELGRRHKVTAKRGGAAWDDMLNTPMDVLLIPGKPDTAIVELDKRRKVWVPMLVGLVLCGFGSALLYAVLQGG